MPVESFVIVHDEGLYQGAGLVSRWFHTIGGETYANVKAAAPVRSGRLKAGVTLNFTRAGRRILSADVASTAPHTGYVIHGTAANGTGYIFSTLGWRRRQTVFRIREALFTGGGRGAVREAIGRGGSEGLWMKLSDSRDGIHLIVHGQKRNNFMVKGYNATARTHRSLKPISEVTGSARGNFQF
jgi:hypothetical protein